MKGFAVAKNKYVLFEPEELDAVKLELTRIISIEEFVDLSSIDRIYWDEPYYLAPSGKTGIEAYAVIRAAMEKQDKVALSGAWRRSARAHLRLGAARGRHSSHHAAQRRGPFGRRGIRRRSSPNRMRMPRWRKRSSHSRRPSSIRASSRTATRTHCAT